MKKKRGEEKKWRKKKKKKKKKGMKTRILYGNYLSMELLYGWLCFCMEFV